MVRGRADAPEYLAVITNAYPREQECAKVIGVWAAIGSVALPAGPPFGGALIQAARWRLDLLCERSARSGRRRCRGAHRGRGTTARGRRLDPAGMAFGAVLLGLVTFVFIEGGRSGLSGIVIATGIATALIGLVLVATEVPRDDPVLPLPLFRDASLSTANMVAGVMNLCTLGLLFTLIRYLQDVRRHSPLAAGVELLPLVSASVPDPAARRPPDGTNGSASTDDDGTSAGGGWSRSPHWLGAVSGYLVMLPALLAWGVGLTLLTPAVVAAAVGAVPGERAGLASAVTNTARQASGAVGIAAFGALAGEPREPGFLAGFHLAAAIAAALFLFAGTLTARYIPATG